MLTLSQAHETKDVLTEPIFTVDDMDFDELETENFDDL